VWEFFRPLLKGATIYVIPDDVIYDPKPLTAFLAEYRIHEVLFTPSLLETLLNAIDRHALGAALSCLRVLWLNGEVVTTRLKQRAIEALPESVRLINTYSISECHDVASLDLRRSEDRPSGFCTVGYPIDGIAIRLLDEHMQPVPNGQVGELYIGGPCVARGYLDKPDLTAERFVLFEGERFYRTGDLAFIHPDGNIEIRGRCDFMVKIRGYSIHLGAIETALLEHPDVKSCAVIAQGAEGEDKRLVAYVVQDEQADWHIHAGTGICLVLREWLKPHLPDYMIPSVYVALQAIPMNPTTGKLNQKRLPPPPQQQDGHGIDIQLVDSASDAERKTAMKALWERVLSLQAGRVKDDSNFFDFGGHSLLAVKLTGSIENLFGRQLSVKDIYTYSTVEALLDYIDDRVDAALPQLTLREEACLPIDIRPASHGKPLALPEANTVFLTGATGFLGAFVLDEILRATHDRVNVYCLTRLQPGDERDGMARITANLQHYGLWDERYAGRIIPLIGDLTQKYLGLDAFDFDSLAQNIDFIFHCAALVNYVYPYAIIKPHTVEGTQEVLRLASMHVHTPLYYISTNGIFAAQASTVFRENSDIDAFAAHLSTGYTQAKWVAEKLVWQAASRGLPVCVFRPGNVGHHRLTGAVNRNDFQFNILHACLKVDCAPAHPAWTFEFTPIDFLAQSIVQFAHDATHFGQVYHVMQTEPIAARAVFDHLIQEHYISRYVSVQHWLSRLQAKANTENDYILSVVAQSIHDVEADLTNRHTYDCSRFEDAVRKCGLNRPHIDITYFMPLLQRYKAAELSTAYRN
jgi:thioester reductase-like protein